MSYEDNLPVFFVRPVICSTLNDGPKDVTILEILHQVRGDDHVFNPIHYLMSKKNNL